MKRLPLFAFGAMALATIVAFFLIQSVKSKAPFIWDKPTPAPVPAAFDPRTGRDCQAAHKPGTPQVTFNYRHTQLAIGLPHAGQVEVSVVNNAGVPVATLPVRSLAATKFGKVDRNGIFTWNGRESDGQIAPNGRYFFHVLLVAQGRNIPVTTPITLMTTPPHPKVFAVSLSPATTTSASGTSTSTTTTSGSTTPTNSKSETRSGSAGGPAILTPGQANVTIRYRAGAYRRAWIYVYRTDVSGKPQFVTRLRVENPRSGMYVWNGELHNDTPVPAGTYLVGMRVQNSACIPASYPVVLPPSAGTAPDIGLTVRYLAATPPLDPTPAGSAAAVKVDSPVGAFTWALRLAGHGKLLKRGQGAAGSSTIKVRLPAANAALYKLTLSNGTESTSVPLVASGTNKRATGARVLVVMPMLSWQGENQVDDSGDGLPSTLSAGDAIELERPFAHGLPSSFGDEATLLAYLSSQHLRYQLTTDVALAGQQGPSLVDRWGVLLSDETWLPKSLDSLTGFVEDGGRALVLGSDSLQASSQISGYPADPVAGAPQKQRTDIFGASHGPLTPTGADLITELTDQLGLLSAAPAFSGFHQFEPIEPPAGVPASLAGIADGAPAVTAFKLEHGYVMEVGIDGFTPSLARNIDSQNLLSRFWQLLAR